MHLDLSDEETAALVRLLSDTIDRDRYPLSPRILTLKSILSKIEPQHHPSPGCDERRVDGSLRLAWPSLSIGPP
jgi:hypothetical protein